MHSKWHFNTFFVFQPSALPHEVIQLTPACQGMHVLYVIGFILRVRSCILAGVSSILGKKRHYDVGRGGFTHVIYAFFANGDAQTTLFGCLGLVRWVSYWHHKRVSTDSSSAVLRSGLFGNEAYSCWSWNIQRSKRLPPDLSKSPCCSALLRTKIIRAIFINSTDHAQPGVVSCRPLGTWLEQWTLWYCMCQKPSASIYIGRLGRN